MSTQTSIKSSFAAVDHEVRHAPRHENRLEGQWATLCVVVTTVDSAEAAEAMARVIVSGRGAACVQAEHITSYYEWDEAFQSTPEWRLICKTVPDAVPRLAQLIRENHSYEVPQITMRTERCLQDYAKWLKAQVQV